ncbi:MAG: type II secretory pathway component PulM [Myxococcota bacterium]|jgi:type II secretory pathway component PulM
MSTPKRLGGGVVDAVERQLENMSQRDRRLLVGLLAFMGLAVVGVLWFVLYNSLEDKASRVRDAKSKLEEVQVLQREYLAAAAQAEAQETRLRAYQGRPVSAYIEQIAGEQGILDYLRAVNSQGSPEVVGTIKQTIYTVDMQRVPELDSLVRFLHELETGGYPARVDTANFRTTVRRDELTYNLKLDLVVYSLAEG